MYGKSIITTQDPLVPISLESVAQKLINPERDVQDLVQQLHIIRSLDNNRYQQKKKQLPYIICGHFSPSIRHNAHFLYTTHFILDIDHISDKHIDIDELFSQLCSDNRVVLAFHSPSGDGIKLIFELKHKCSDPGIYKLFYKAFCLKYSEQYQLEDMLDTRTCDVARACFLSQDKHTYFNTKPELIDINHYIDMEDAHTLFSLSKEIDETFLPSEQKRDEEDKAYQQKDPNNDVMSKIKALLIPKAAKKQAEKMVYVPEILNDIEIELKEILINTGAIVEFSDINYGKKIHVRVASKEAEVNLFYGKKGFSIVESPKKGTSSEMNELIHAVIQGYIEQL